jgi:hypothetical protein
VESGFRFEGTSAPCWQQLRLAAPKTQRAIEAVNGE